MPYQPIYADLDLATFDPALAGEAIQLLQNPTRGFRRDFLASTGDAFRQNIAFICHCAVEELEARFDPYDAALFSWLFVGALDDGRVILPHVYDLWDDYTATRLKVLSGNSLSSPRAQAASPASESAPT